MPEEALPKKFGRYEVASMLGEGAMGTVYLAIDPSLNRKVAIKAMRTDLRLPTRKALEYRERFLREAQAAARLNHPCVVSVYDVGVEGPTPYFAMEHIDGQSLKELIRSELEPQIEDVLWLAERVCSALTHAHASGIVHRDIKPANILISNDHKVKVTDFGIARMDDSEMTQEGAILGSPNFMSPEQISGKKVDLRSDLFSLAVILYRWLTASRPFDGEDLRAITYAIVHTEPMPPSQINSALDARIDRFFGKALAKSATDRFASAVELYEALERALASTAIPAAASPRPYEAAEATIPVSIAPQPVIPATSQTADTLVTSTQAQPMRTVTATPAGTLSGTSAPSLPSWARDGTKVSSRPALPRVSRTEAVMLDITRSTRDMRGGSTLDRTRPIPWWIFAAIAMGAAIGLVLWMLN